MIKIAVGLSRKSEKWVNQEITWEKLAKKLSTPIRTNETIAQYLKASKDQQADIKDVGGFVGGEITGKNRVKGSISNRKVLTLDLDTACSTTIDDVDKQLDGLAYLVYSTHKHTKDMPRYRVVVLLDRGVNAEEYEAVIRRLAEMIDMAAVDHTSFEYERLMYYPSTASDGDFYYKLSKSIEPLSVQMILDTYADWRNVAEWPLAPAEDKVMKRTIDRQGEPTTKSGFVGAFCRAYDIDACIEKFIPDVYVKAGENRYTYVEGSTAAGVVVYDDKFAYSHHSTDPAGCKLSNSFDLVRIHKFGYLDEETKAGTPINKMPSFKTFTEFLEKDVEVKKQLIADSVADFEVSESADWLTELDTTKEGEVKSTVANVVTIFRNDPNLKGLLVWDDFAKRAILSRSTKWREIYPSDNEMSDRDDAFIREYLESRYALCCPKKLEDAMVIEAFENKIHPVRDYLESLTWDGQKRLETLFTKYLGVADNEYSRVVTRKFLTAAVARVYSPGKKFDNMLVFVGEQGVGKSSVVKALGRRWFSDSLGQIGTKESYEQLQGVWIVELAELSALRKSDVETVKHFISKPVDRFRVAYGRRSENFPRQCVFIGTTNKHEFLTDVQNRRFNPLETMVVAPSADFRTDLMDQEIDQVWAEAKHLYEKGESLYLNKEEELLAIEVQKEHTEQDNLQGVVEDFLESAIPEKSIWDQYTLDARIGFLENRTNKTDWDKDIVLAKRDKVCIKEILVECFKQQLGKEDYVLVNKVKTIMANLSSWSNKPDSRARLNFYGQQRCYSRLKRNGELSREILSEDNQTE